MTGIGTVRADNPYLTVRDVETTRQPLRVVVDSRLETPVDANVVGAGTLIAAAANHVALSQALRACGAEITVLPNAENKVALPDLMLELGRRGINELHVEAGYKLNGSLVHEGLVDELLIYIGPSLLGDVAQSMFHLPALTALRDQIRLTIADVCQIGPDIRVRARVTPV